MNPLAYELEEYERKRIRKSVEKKRIPKDPRLVDPNARHRYSDRLGRVFKEDINDTAYDEIHYRRHNSTFMSSARGFVSVFTNQFRRLNNEYPRGAQAIADTIFQIRAPFMMRMQEANNRTLEELTSNNRDLQNQYREV